MIHNIEYNNNDTDIVKNINVHIDWGRTTQTSLLHYPREIFEKIMDHLFIYSPRISGKVLPNLYINGYIEIQNNGNIFIMHPQFWIMMIIDLSDCNIIYDIDQDTETLSLHSDQRRITNLTKENWFIALVGENSETVDDDLTYSYFDSKIHTCIKIHTSTTICMVPLSSLMSFYNIV